MQRVIRVALCGLLLVWGITGCRTDESGAARFAFAWPAADAVPGVADVRGAQSLRLDLQGAGSGKRIIVNRPAALQQQVSAIVLNGLTLGDHTFTATAYALPDGQGERLGIATGEYFVTIAAQPVMTIAAGEPTDIQPSGTHWYAHVGQTRQLAPGALTGSSALLVPVETTYTLTSDAPDILSVSSTNLLTARRPGIAHLTVTTVLHGDTRLNNWENTVTVEE